MTDAVPASERRAVRPGHRTRLWRAGIPIGAGVVLALLPSPPGLAPFAWHYLALFVTVILTLITEPIPPAGAGLMGVTLAGVLGLAFSPAQIADPAFKFPAESSVRVGRGCAPLCAGWGTRRRVSAAGWP